MDGKWITRKAHTRKLSGGGATFVQQSTFWRETKKSSKPIRKTKCPFCGIEIVRRRNPKGGFFHTEATEGLERVLHPCLHRSAGLRKPRKEDMDDLFDDPSITSNA